jgi:hypothetical protein
MERRELLGEIMEAVEDDFKAILELAEAAPAGELLEATELEVRRRALRCYGMLLRGVIVLASREGDGRRRAPECGCGQRMRMAYRGQKTVTTVLGPMVFSRRYYHCRCGRRRVPFDEEVGLERGGFSAGARRLITRCGTAESFREAAAGLKELAEIRVSAETVREVTEGVAREVEGAQEGKAFCGEEQAIDFTTAGGSSRAYVSVDGTMVNTLDGWREAKVGAIYNQGKDQQHYLGGISEAGAFGMEMRGHADAVGALSARQRVAIGDGAAWIWKQMGIQFPGSVEVVDYYHLSEQVWTCARAMYGEGTAAAAQWSARRLQEISEGGPRRLMKSLRRWKRRRRRKEERKALGALLGYVVERQERLRYPAFRRAGIDIGSGPVESACRHVVGRRLKGGGMRWSLANAQAMLRLRALRASTGSWEAYWQRRPHAA